MDLTVFLLITVSGLGAVYGGPLAGPVIVPDCESLHGPESYPNLKQRNTYYQCVHGTPVLLYCPSRQEFNAAIGKCEALRDIESYVDVDTSDIKCTYEGEFICNPLNPKSFYQCSFGKPHLHDCPAGLIFDLNLNTCNFGRQQDGCGIKCSFEGQYIVNPHNPKSFYQCSHGRPILHDCPANLIFDPILNVCVRPPQEAVEVPSKELPMIPDETDLNCFEKPDGPNPKAGQEYDRHYVICEDGNTVEEKTCPGDLDLNPIFDPDTRKCEKDQEERDRCEGTKEESGLFPDLASDCQYYFLCRNHRFVGDLRTCPKGTKFQPRTMECDYPSYYCAPCGTKNC